MLETLWGEVGIMMTTVMVILKQIVHTEHTQTQVYSPGHYSFAILWTKFSPTLFSRAISEVSKACSIWNYKAEYLFPVSLLVWS